MILPSTRAASLDLYRRALSSAIAKGIQDSVERELALNDLFFLLVYVLGRKDINRDWLFERCREVQAEPNGRLDLWPREHYKSTILTFGLTIQDILRDPELTVGIFSFNRPTAKKFLFQIRQEFTANEKLKRLFPDILWENPHRDAPKWSEDDGFIVRRKSNPKESTVEAWGLVDGQPTSKHYRLMIYDDMLTADSVTTPEMIAKVTRGWETSRALRTEDGVSRYIGTRWHYNDTYREILARGSAIERKHVVTYEGTVEGTPVLRSRQWVSEQRRDMGPYVFSAQMMMDPAADRAQGFHEEWLREYTFRSDSDYAGMNKYLLVDAANSRKKGSDYTAMVMIGLGSDQNYYLLDGIRDRLNLRERGDAVFALHRRWRPTGVGYEEYGLMADIEYVKERQKQENYRFEVTKLAGRMEKNDRIRRMIPVFEAGRFWLPEHLLKVDYEGRHIDLVQTFINEEYKPFPVGLHDDFFDALSRIADPEMGLVWPKPAGAPEDRYARPRSRTRRHSSWAA